MEKTYLILNDTHSIFFNRSQKENEIDDNTFNMWKTELEKELPSFWESMKHK